MNELPGVTRTLYGGQWMLKTAVDKRRVVEELLESETFRRAEQMKRLLRYLVEQEEAGRSHEVTEYELGVAALGRREDFSPETDSSVRTRLHGLRQRLEEHYAGREGWRLEVPKGSYRPVYVRVGEDKEVERGKWWGGAAVVAGVVVLLLAAWWGWPRESAMERLWRPVVGAGVKPVLLVGQPVHVWVRDIQGQAEEALDYPHFPDALPESEFFRRYWKPRMNEGARLVLHPSPNATLWGDAVGAAGAARFLGLRMVNSEMVPESALRSEVALKGKPVLAFGRPEYSLAIARYLRAAGGYEVGMGNELKRYAIYRGAERYVNERGANETNHGLVTVMRDGGARVMVFSGITSDGSAAGIEYLTEERMVGELWEKLRGEGYGDWPAVFQVVLKISSSNGYAMAARYEKHLVLQK
ncbi:MAG: hypothetical protein ACK6DX_19225 [Acidobacteriota bacterium]